MNGSWAELISIVLLVLRTQLPIWNEFPASTSSCYWLCGMNISIAKHLRAYHLPRNYMLRHRSYLGWSRLSCHSLGSIKTRQTISWRSIWWLLLTPTLIWSLTSLLCGSWSPRCPVCSGQWPSAKFSQYWLFLHPWQPASLRGRVIWPRQEVTIRTIQRFCRGHLRARVHSNYVLPGRLILGQNCFPQMLVWVCRGVCGVCGVWFIEQMLFAMLTSFRFGISPWPHFQKYRTFPDILAVFMVGSDFSMNIPIKTTMNLQLHYTYSDQPSKMAVLEGTSTNYPNKSQLGRISYEFIKQNEKKKKKQWRKNRS